MPEIVAQPESTATASRSTATDHATGAPIEEVPADAPVTAVKHVKKRKSTAPSTEGTVKRDKLAKVERDTAHTTSQQHGDTDVPNHIRN